MTAGWCARTTRAAVFAAMCVLLAALGHVLMSGTDVPAWAPAAGFAVTAAAGWCLAGRERGLPLIVTAVVVAQTVLHEAFSYAQSTSAVPMSAVPVSAASVGPAVTDTDGMDRMDMGSTGRGALDMDATPTLHPSMGHMAHMAHMGHTSHAWHMGQHSMDGGSSSLGMLAAHLLAAVLCGLWLAQGERAAFRVLRAAAGRLAAPLRLLLALPATPDGPRVHPRRCRSDRAPRLLLLVHAITSRGPPAEAAVA
ncbi:hypothetical protein [Streptomyces naphthomycinicus]|uniref:hypothetical protein n=1 Tax=Streptomyces naphthomycinicus TaxID=2872625 RepID=UPI001CEC0A2C|nr:hypothetical protein [Streptomyces sp. TML10]